MVNLQAEKLQLIEWLVQLQDTAVIQQIKALKEQEADITPLSVEELHQRALDAERDIEEGNVTPLRDMMKENWSV